MSLLLDEVAIATVRLAEAGVDSPRTDAEVIAAHVHGVRRAELHLVRDPDFDPRFWEEVAGRPRGEPLSTSPAWLTSATGSLRWPGVFVPRPETEVMTGWAVAKLLEVDVAKPVVADLGTGSGAIALAIAQEVPRALVHAVEADPVARQWAARNIARCARYAPHTAGRVSLHAADFADALSGLDGAVDLVISNPPYIPVGASVPPEVAEYDPAGALWGGEDGLDAIRVVEAAARRLLRPEGLVAVEHGAPQGSGVYWVFAEERGWQDTRNHKDLASRDRFVTARWPRPARPESRDRERRPARCAAGLPPAGGGCGRGAGRARWQDCLP